MSNKFYFFQVPHHVTDIETPSFNKFMEASFMTRQMHSPHFVDFDKKRGRGREKIKEMKIRDKSRARDKSRDERPKDIKSRDKSREPKARNKFAEKGLDLLRERSGSGDGSGDIILIRPGEKTSQFKAHDNRKLAKQNTYIFQNGHKTKQQIENKAATTEKTKPTKSVENLDYSRVADDISARHYNRLHSEETYAEICTYSAPSSKSTDPASFSDVKYTGSKAVGKQKPLNNSNYDSIHNDYHSNSNFTLLKKDLGKFYVKIAGLSISENNSTMSRDVSVC